MRGRQVNFKGTYIIRFISCDKVFSRINNKLGENICYSNMGNLENLKRKYDKSIIFLTKSLELDDEDEGSINKDLIFNMVDNIFEKDDVKIRNNNSINGKSTFNREGTIKESINKNDIESNINNIEFIRFMKLFYSNVKKIEKILNKTLHMTKTKNYNGEENYQKSDVYICVKSLLLYYNDYFISNSIHIHKKYKNSIFICI